MNKILITGADSYIGTSLTVFLNQWADQYIVDTVDMIDGSWKEKNFSGYDFIYHIAGIAHIKETKKNAYLYYKVNRDLAIEVAKKAKADDVKHFILMSSMSVYGLDTGIITCDTPVAPKTNYGKSKYQAEQAICKLADNNFNVCIIRPPMVYGKNCKGNFNTMIKIVKLFPVFPIIKNSRSMIYIDNLCNFIKKVIDEGITGIHYPQNSAYMNTTDIAKWIAEKSGKRIYMSYILGLCVKIISPLFGKTRKAFGTLIYKNTEEFNFDYCIIENEKSVKQSV